MKKIYSLAFILALCSQVNAQVLNEPAGWPNANWTITGEYNPDPLAFEADPTTTANFAFDDDDSGSATLANEDHIAAESPIIDLTAAFTANEKSLEITVSYAFNKYADDVLQFQYWDANASAWMAWTGGNIPDNGSATDNFCSATKTTHVTAGLDISNFTPTQLSGFRYRIFYDDDPDGAAWNYGFCLDSPTLMSVACSGITNLAVADVLEDSASFTWTAVSGVAGYQYALDENAAAPAIGAPITEAAFSATNLAPETVYYFHVRTNCGGIYGPWNTITFTTRALPPANDACADAIVVDVLPYINTQDATTASNNEGTITTCGTGMNDGVWYTFTGNGSGISVMLTDVEGWDPEIGVYTGTCGDFTCVGFKDNGGNSDNETFNFTSEAGVVYYVNVGHYNGVTDFSEGPFTILLDTFVPAELPENDSCATATAIDSLPYTNAQDATAATNNNGFVATCAFGANDGVWYTFTGDGADITVAISEIVGWDPELSVYTGTCGEFVCAGSADDGGTGGGETVTVAATEVGTTYFVNVAHFSGTTDNPEGPFSLSVSSALAATSFKNSDFKSYPNPVADVLNVSYTKNITNVAVFNMLGQQVLTKSVNATTGKIDVSSLNGGTYIVKVASGSETKTIKIIKM